MTDRTRLPWIGNMDQLLTVRRFQMTEGRAAGLTCIDVQTAAGLDFTVTEGRAMSLYHARFRGTNLAFLPAGGPTGPEAVSESGYYYEGGLMFTCGLESTGPANGYYSQHGTLRMIPAENVKIKRLERDGVAGVEITGTMIPKSEAAGEKLRLQRTYICWNDAPVIHIHDKVCNLSSQPAGLMVMYHFNLGWPLLSPEARLYIPSRHIRPKNSIAQRDLNTCLNILPPQEQWQPQVFCHTLDSSGGHVKVMLENPKIGVGIGIQLDPHQLPMLNQWRSFYASQYVLGLEPCNCLPLGRTCMQEKGLLPWLQPGEEREFQMSFFACENLI